MKNLAFSKKFIFTLFAVLIGVNLWGQAHNLEWCDIIINGNNPYLHTGSNIIVNASDIVVMDEEEEVSSGFNISIVDANDVQVTIGVTEIGIGQYTLTISASDASCTGEQIKNFYVLPGSSTYYTISNETDWNRFADCVNDGYSFEEKTVKLTTSINVGAIDGSGNITANGKMVGYSYNYFKGTFHGQNNTLRFYYTATNDWGYAPFYATDGATITNLIVAGKINAQAGYVAGLICYNYNSTSVNYVTVSLEINSAKQEGCGGFAVYNQSGLNFSNCVYNGKIVTGNGGFCGSSYYWNGANFTNCIFAPASGSAMGGGYSFTDAPGTITNCYSLELENVTLQGTLAYTNYPSDEITKKVTVNGTTVYGKVDVTTTAEETYLANGTNYYSEIMDCTVYFDNNQADGEYEVSITDELGGSVNEQVINKGTYKLVITTKTKEGRVYYGSETKTFYVVDDLTGGGTQDNPFLIRSSFDWRIFENHVNNGHTYTDAQEQVHNYSEAYYKLTNDITVSTMVGTPTRPFKGNFSGLKGEYAAYTLTFNYGTSGSPTTEEIVAPFRYTEDAAFSSLIVDGAIYTNVGKEAGLIGVNTHTSGNNTTVQFVINNMDFYCYEDLLDSEGGGYAYDGSDISFLYCSYEGKISANNYHGGFCGKADEHTTFTRCLFDPEPEGFYWAENFVYDEQGATINYNGTSETTGCFYTVGPNQEESEQGTMVFVNSVPEGNVGKKLTTFHEKVVYKPVTVVISGVKKRYTYTGNDITITPTVTFNGTNALTNNYCEWSITPTYPMHDLGQYTFTLTAPKQGVTSDYLGTINQIIRVVNPSSAGWTGLQAKLSGSDATINLTADIIAGENDACLIVENGRTVTINLNGYKIDRGFYNGSDNWDAPVTGGQVLKIGSGATVIINGAGENGNGKIMGGSNKAPTSNEHAENSDAGGIFNMGNLTLNNVIIEGNYCEKKSQDVSRTARGGGIYSGNGSTLIINNCTITHNEAKGGGGGLFVEKAAVFEMKNTGVKSNKTQDKGGGVRLNADGTKHNNDAKALVGGALIKDCDIENNEVVLHDPKSASNGGGIHLDAGTLYLTNGTVKNNRCSKYGGGIYLMGGTINASGCDILYNQSYDETYMFEGLGGGVCLLGGTYKMMGGTISGNSSYREDGGGIYVSSGRTLRLEGSVTITENWTIENGTTGDKHTTNVYLAGENGKINISGNIAGSTIGVSKKGNTGVFTSGLNGKGTIANFRSDKEAYSIVSYYNEAKLTTISPVDPPVSGVWEINGPVILQETVPSVGHDVTSIVIGENGFLYVNEGGYINNVPITNNTSNAVNKLVINGGQVFTTTTNVPATVKKDIKEAYVSSQADWYLISSPLVTLTGNNPIGILDRTNLIVLSANNYPEYDLYRFNEGATVTNASGYELQWENYRANHADFTTLEKGRGYLYRNYLDYTITMTGAINVSGFDYALSYHAEVNSHDNMFKGFNIIGNPYTHNISKGITDAAIPNTYLEAKYYVLDETDGSWDLTNDGTAIPPVTGILVQAKSANTTLTITNSTIVGGSKGAANNNIWFTVANSKYDDRACVEFRNGRGLNKIAHPNENVPMLYIRHNDEDFASVDMNPEAKQFDLYFETATLGQYTLTVNPQGNYSYLHLIDKVAEEDIDLLKENEYSFIGSPSDNADRFVVRLNNSESSDNSTFAYQSGNDIVVCGDGELQVFDVMGRLVAQKRVNGVESIDKPQTTGVYIIKLNDKTQKIVID